MKEEILSLADRDQLYGRARQYLQLEQDPTFQREVAQLLDQQDDQEIFERFYSALDFGTGGVRALIGGGSNRINPYSISKISQGLANYILEQTQDEPSVVIAHDSRHYSAEFSLQAAAVFAANGIRAYLFPSLRPTPQLSFSVRRLQATAGIMITASHNPPSYNGYKVYWEDGSQVTAPHDQNIIAQINRVSGAVRYFSEAQARMRGLIVQLDQDFDQAYIDQIYGQILAPELVREWAPRLKVVYTPLHGAGRSAIEAVAAKMGVDMFTVPEQAEPDGDFPTVQFPNPEEASAMELGLKWARKRSADLLMGSDPDADRLGIAAPLGSDYQLISGNQLGALLLDYICHSYQEKGLMPPRPAFLNTIVTTPLQAKIAASYNVTCFQTLTGFKHLAALIRKFEEEQSYQVLFSTEESYGYLVGNEVRDKDAVAAAAMTMEMTLWNISQGRSVFAHLQQLYQRFGFHDEHTINIKFPGASGQQEMAALMDKLRQQAPTSIAGQTVTILRDYQRQIETHHRDGQTQTIDLPASNVLQFVTADQTVITMRPSGTEPKMKIYLCLCQPDSQRKQLADNMKAYEKALLQLLGQ